MDGGLKRERYLLSGEGEINGGGESEREINAKSINLFFFFLFLNLSFLCAFSDSSSNSGLLFLIPYPDNIRSQTSDRDSDMSAVVLIDFCSSSRVSEPFKSQ